METAFEKLVGELKVGWFPIKWGSYDFTFGARHDLSRRSTSPVSQEKYLGQLTFNFFLIHFHVVNNSSTKSLNKEDNY